MIVGDDDSVNPLRLLLLSLYQMSISSSRISHYDGSMSNLDILKWFKINEFIQHMDLSIT